MGHFGPKHGSKQGQKRIFQSYDGPFGILKQGFFARFEPVVTVLADGKPQNALSMDSLGTQDGSKMGQKCIFTKVILHHWGG